MPNFRSAPLGYLSYVTLTWLVVFLATRSILLIMHWSDAQLGFGSVLAVFGIGFAYDLAFLVYALVPLTLYVLLCPERLWRTRTHQNLLITTFGISLFVMLFVALSEWFFWDEFGVRFNFIAVDYLVYSKEVIDNILESYPVYPLVAFLALLASLVTAGLYRKLLAALGAPTLPWMSSFVVLGALASLVACNALVLDQHSLHRVGGNAYERELASNGPFQFFAAFRNNELDYRQFYATLPQSVLGPLLRAEVAETNATFLSQDPLDIRRTINNPGTPERYNVVLVTIESLSAKYLGSFGDTRGLTPNLDKMRQESLIFTNFYATGTRTDRGLEAITLSIPPTPGRSIVKRIGRESGYASLGQQLNAKGYDSVFVYGGRGYFDNMNAFFSGNGYRIIDQSSVPNEQMAFTNAWGMSDEDLYQETIKLADADYAQGKPFLLQLMTTSNHRPYTYPDGRIDIHSGDGREGAVKYTDYAIGQFLEQARKKPWFDRTIFLFVADHTAGSAGREDLPIANYHIPLFIYAPRIVPAQEYTGLASQIDIAPTLLGLLNQSYTSTFFGHDLLRADHPNGRALIGNYQNLGLFDGENLAILSPPKEIRRRKNAKNSGREIISSTEDPLIKRAIAYYQGASHSFTEGLLKWQRSTETAPDATAP